MARRGRPVGPTAHNPDSRTKEAGSWGPRNCLGLPPYPSQPCPLLCPGRASPSVCPQHFLPPSPSSPHASHSSFHQLPHPLFSVHICFSLLCLHGSPCPPSLSHPGCLYPFISPPSPSPPPLTLPVPEARTSKGDQSCAPPSKTRLCQERPPTTPSHPHRVDCNSP